MTYLVFLLLLFGGFLLAATTGISYFCCTALPSRRRFHLGLLCLAPLLSIAIFLIGLPGAIHRPLVIAPCLAAAILFLITLRRGNPSAYTLAPARAFTAGAGILWAGGITYAASDSCFMGACC